jgi:hypothetical protein
MTLPTKNVLGDLNTLSTREVLDRVKGLSLEQLIKMSKNKLPFGITLRSLKKLQADLRAQGIPEPGPRFSLFVYVEGPITPTKYCPSEQLNVERIHRACFSLFLLGYRPYCPSVQWFKNPSTFNLWYYLILYMDEHMVLDSKWAYVCAHSWTSRGVNFEETVGENMPRYYESKRDKKYFEKMKRARQKEKAHPAVKRVV